MGINLRIVNAAGQEANLHAKEIISIDGEPYQSRPPIDLSALEFRVAQIEKFLGEMLSQPQPPSASSSVGSASPSPQVAAEVLQPKQSE